MTIDLTRPYCQIRNRPSRYEFNVTQDFGVTDKKGRALGASVALFECDYVQVAVKLEQSYSGPYVVDADPSEHYCPLQVEPGHVWGFIPCSTRDGDGFGACQSERYFRSQEERDAAVEKYFKSARNRAVRQFGQR